KLVLSLEPFEWDAQGRIVAVTPTLHGLSWKLRSPDPDDFEQPGPPFISEWVSRDQPSVVGHALVEHVEARGGPAYLEVHRGPGCAPSIIPLRQLPGYGQRDLGPAPV